MNIFSRIKNAVTGVFGGALKRNAERPSVHETRNGKLIFQAPPRMITIWSNGGRPIFGPSVQSEREDHHLSRQTCRAYLRNRMFASVSQGNPLMPRRERRRFARLFACLEYRRMMTDGTNAIPDEAERIYRDMTAEELTA